MRLLFYTSCFLVVFTYALYPIWLALKKLRHIESDLTRFNNENLPIVSVVIAAYNEEKHIINRINDICKQNYPQELLQIVVISDGSTDSTVERLYQLKLRNLVIIPIEINQGKAVALNEGVSAASGEFIVFTDSRQTFHSNTIRHLVDRFMNRKIGCVSGELILLASTNNSLQLEMGAYWLYEKWIRHNESLTGSMVGASGAVYAIRKNLYQPLPRGIILDDVLTPMNIARKGYLCKFAPDAIAYDIVSKDFQQEWTRKVRTLTGNWQLLFSAPYLLNPLQNILWARFICHKFLRLLVPFFLVIIFFTTLLLNGRIYQMVLFFQILTYSLALIAWIAPKSRKIKLIGIIYFFVLMNTAVAVGLWKLLTGKSQHVWNKK